MRSQLWARHEQKGAPFLVSEERARLLNTPEQGYGISWMVNECHEGDRKKITKINSHYIDIDTKPELSQLMKRFHLLPSLIIETANGYHIYWNAIGASYEKYELIQKRLIHFYNADENARDIARLLRVPGYYHLKEASQPFLVRSVFSLGVKYSEKKHLFHLPPHPDEIKRETKPTITKPTSYGDSFFDKIHNADQLQLLSSLSGKHFVEHQVYTFRRRSDGGYHIDVNGKAADAWIDSMNRIGSKKRGGPSVWEWLKFFGHTNKAVEEILKQEFPNL